MSATRNKCIAEYPNTEPTVKVYLEINLTVGKRDVNILCMYCIYVNLLMPI